MLQTGWENGGKVSSPLEILHACCCYSERTLIALKTASMGNRSIVLFNFSNCFLKWGRIGLVLLSVLAFWGFFKMLFWFCKRCLQKSSLWVDFVAGYEWYSDREAGSTFICRRPEITSSKLALTHCWLKQHYFLYCMLSLAEFYF